jgi:hypothetical protein
VVLLWMVAVFVVTLTAGPAPAFARGRAKVDWTKIEVPGDDSARITRVLRKLLNEAVRKADFGKVQKVSASAHVVELTWEKRGDVLRMSCAIVGRLKDGPRARSRVSFGGSPDQRSELEKQVLTMVANGMVTRLAEMARSR